MVHGSGGEDNAVNVPRATQLFLTIPKPSTLPSSWSNEA
jgi:hypothetical protein